MPAYQDCEDDSITAAPRAIVNSNKVSITERGATLLVVAILSVITGIALIRSDSAADKAEKAERESRMLQYYVLEMDAKLIAAGVKTPEEAVSKRLEK